MASIYDRLKYNGLYIIPYDLVRMLGTINAMVLIRLITEKNLAFSSEKYPPLSALPTKFLICKSSLCEYLQLTQERLIEALNKLASFRFIRIERDKLDYMLITLEERAIVNKVQNTSREMKYPTWYADINKIYNLETHKKYFKISTQQIIEYCENKGITFLTHTYCCIDKFIEEYECGNEGKFFYTFKEDLKTFIDKLVKNSRDNDYSLYSFILNIWYKAKKTN